MTRAAAWSARWPGSPRALTTRAPLGDRRRTLLGVPVAAGPHAQEPRPPAATLHRAAEAPAADWAGGPGVLGRAAARVGAMGRCGRDREARDGDRVAPCGLLAVLELALEAGKVARQGSGWSGGQGSCPEDGARERVGRSADPRRVAEAGVHGLRAHRLALHAKARAFTGTEAELAHVPRPEELKHGRDGRCRPRDKSSTILSATPFWRGTGDRHPSRTSRSAGQPSARRRRRRTRVVETSRSRVLTGRCRHGVPCLSRDQVIGEVRSGAHAGHPGYPGTPGCAGSPRLALRHLAG